MRKQIARMLRHKPMEEVAQKPRQHRAPRKGNKSSRNSRNAENKPKIFVPSKYKLSGARREQFKLVMELKPDWSHEDVHKLCLSLDFEPTAISQALSNMFEDASPKSTTDSWSQVSHQRKKKEEPESNNNELNSQERRRPVRETPREQVAPRVMRTKPIAVAKPVAMPQAAPVVVKHDSDKKPSFADLFRAEPEPEPVVVAVEPVPEPVREEIIEIEKLSITENVPKKSKRRSKAKTVAAPVEETVVAEEVEVKDAGSWSTESAEPADKPQAPIGRSKRSERNRRNRKKAAAVEVVAPKEDYAWGKDASAASAAPESPKPVVESEPVVIEKELDLSSLQFGNFETESTVVSEPVESVQIVEEPQEPVAAQQYYYPQEPMHQYGGYGHPQYPYMPAPYMMPPPNAYPMMFTVEHTEQLLAQAYEYGVRGLPLPSVYDLVQQSAPEQSAPEQQQAQYSRSSRRDVSEHPYSQQQAMYAQQQQNYYHYYPAYGMPAPQQQPQGKEAWSFADDTRNGQPHSSDIYEFSGASSMYSGAPADYSSYQPFSGPPQHQQQAHLQQHQPHHQRQAPWGQ